MSEPPPPGPARVHADLEIEGPGTRMRLTGRGGPLRLELDGAPPRTGPRGARRVGDGLARAGIRLEVVDGRGRRLAVAGHGVRSLAGRLLGAGPHVRPTPRGVWRRLRGRRS